VTAEEANKAKSAFLANMSHELRTPMTIIKESLAQVLDGLVGEVTDGQRKMLSMAMNNIDRLARIINNLLDISKLEAGKAVLNREVFDFVTLVREVSAGFHVYVQGREIELRDDFCDEKIEIMADRDKIIQVLTNLMGNAFKFTEKGYIAVAVVLRGDYAECSVADTGKGISQDDLPKVFSKFQQFGRQYGPGAKGTGLGLAISKGIVELHGGTIRVESRMGKGIRFIFTIPLKAKAKNDQKNGGDVMTKKILVIDDEPDIRDLVRSRLEASRFDVISACDGQEGMEKVEAEKPDLIIADIMMPRMDGFTFILELKRMEGCKDIPVIILTVKEKMEELFKIEGVTDYVVKPFEPEKLMEKVNKYL